jgi:hypothetical protein
LKETSRELKGKLKRKLKGCLGNVKGGVKETYRKLKGTLERSLKESKGVLFGNRALGDPIGQIEFWGNQSGRSTQRGNFKRGALWPAPGEPTGARSFALPL